jgi:hypothetical protein
MFRTISAPIARFGSETAAHLDSGRNAAQKRARDSGFSDSGGAPENRYA